LSSRSGNRDLSTRRLHWPLYLEMAEKEQNIIAENDLQDEDKMPRWLLILFWLIQIIWGFPQTILGFLCFLKSHGCGKSLFHGAVHTLWNKEGFGISLGLFIFTDPEADRRIMTHEYGHCVQSLLLGPLYLLVIGLPSYLWCTMESCKKLRRSGERSYLDFYTERWAERIANRYRR